MSVFVISLLLHNNLTPWYKPISGTMSDSQKLCSPESDGITYLVLLFCPVYPFGLCIYCVSTTQ